MPGALPVNQIESPTSNQTSRVGDGSFDNDLKKAEQDLAAKKKQSEQFSLDQITQLLGFFSINFDFKADNFDVRAEDKPRTESAKTTETTANNTPSKQNQPATQNDRKDIAISDVKAIKEALIKFLPNPVVPIGIMPFTLNQSSGTLSAKRGDLQLLIDKIVEQAKLIKTQKRTELSMMLQDSDLGKISISLTSKEGVISILMTASPELRKSMENKISELEIALKSANIDIDQLIISEVKHEQLFYSRS